MSTCVDRLLADVNIRQENSKRPKMMIKYETITCTPLSMKLADTTFGPKDAKVSST